MVGYAPGRIKRTVNACGERGAKEVAADPVAQKELSFNGTICMKIGFSSLVCPGWGLRTIVEQASDLGFQGVELRGLRGELHLPLVPELSGQPERVRGLFAEKK